MHIWALLSSDQIFHCGKVPSTWASAHDVVSTWLPTASSINIMAWALCACNCFRVLTALFCGWFGFGSTCRLVGNSHCKSRQRSSDWSLSSCDETFLPWEGAVSFRSLTVWFNECENYVNYKSFTRPQPSRRFWADKIDSVQHHHHLTTRWGNIFYKKFLKKSSSLHDSSLDL